MADKNEMPLPALGYGGQRVNLLNSFATQGAPGNIWWVSLNANDKMLGAIPTRDVEAGEMWKMLERIEKQTIMANDLAVACLTEDQIHAHNDAWILDSLDTLIPPEELEFRGCGSVYV